MARQNHTVEELLQTLRKSLAGFETTDIDRERLSEARKWSESVCKNRVAAAMLVEFRDQGVSVEGLLQAILLYRLHPEMIGAAYVEVTADDVVLGGASQMSVPALETLLANLRAVQQSPMRIDVEADIRMVSGCLASLRESEERISEDPEATVTGRVPDADAPGGYRIATIRPERAFAQRVAAQLQPHPDMAEELRGPGKRGQPALSVLTIAVFGHLNACRHAEPSAATARFLAIVADLDPPEGGKASDAVDAHRSRLSRALKKDVLVRRATRFGANAGLVLRLQA